jgi:4-amino-4-deoxy-L-arabinose transferase-like glycosyltransferase
MLFGQSAFTLRASGPVLHLITGLILWQAATHLTKDNSTDMCGRIAALLWLSLPAVGLGSFVMSTDSVMLPFWAGALYFVLASQKTTGQKITGQKTNGQKTNGPSPSRYLFYMAAAGAAIGIASLAKYAGLYFIPCLILFLYFFGDKAQPRLTGFSVFLAGVVLASSPTWVWNLSNEFVTLFHLSENANLEKQSYSFASLAGFFFSQFAVLGPISFATLLTLPFIRKMRNGLSGGLHIFIWPIIGAICLQAFLSEANANWAAASYPAAILLLANFATQLRANWLARLMLPAIIINLFMTACLGVILAAGSFGIVTPKSDPLRRLRGWEVMAQKADRLAVQAGAGTLIAYSRASAALLHWHLADKGYYIALPLPEEASGQGNHYQRSYPLNPTSPRPWLAINEGAMPPKYSPQYLLDWQGPLAKTSIKISHRRTRDNSYWLAR